MPFEITSLEARPGNQHEQRLQHLPEPALRVGGDLQLEARADSHSSILLTQAIKRVDLLTAPVVGLFYAMRFRLVLPNARDGAVLAFKLRRESSSAIARAIRDDQNLLDMSVNAFTSIWSWQYTTVTRSNWVAYGCMTRTESCSSSRWRTKCSADR
jgi:hypothetical protein